MDRKISIQELNYIFQNQNTLSLKINVYNQFLMPLFMYGSETVTPMKKPAGKLRINQIKI